MHVRFWGTRGSIATPGATTLRHGGNTSCVEVRTHRGTLLVLDCGTGAQPLGRALVADPEGPRTAHLLISHTHWDHIQGLPFFRPLFRAGWIWHIYGPRGMGNSLRDTLAGQMQYAYFPVSLDQLAAEVHFHELVEGHLAIDDVEITARYQNHPALTLGYRLEADGAVVVYATDHEPHGEHLAHGGDAERTREDDAHGHFLQGADLVIHDAQYTAEEYPNHVGWGHSTVEFAVDEAARAGVRRLALYHHDPGRDDDAVDALVVAAGQRCEALGSSLEVFAASEGDAFDVVPQSRVPSRPAGGPMARLGPAELELTERPIVMAVDSEEAAGVIEAALEADDLRLVQVDDPAAIERVVLDESPSVVLLSRRVGAKDAFEISRGLRALGSRIDQEMPIVVICGSGEVDPEAGAQAGITDWLGLPLQPTYVRTRLRCWLLRTTCRWVPARLPVDEGQRLQALRDLGLLDTPPEERFDRYARIAAAMFDAPIALVSLVDSDRQWFKARHGIDTPQGPRETAFCAHAILQPEPLIVRDALADDRFAHNPMVTGAPRVRFYAGAPLALKDGSRVGTLCVIDHRPRDFPPGRYQALRDLARLLEDELQQPPASS